MHIAIEDHRSKLDDTNIVVKVSTFIYINIIKYVKEVMYLRE